MRSDHRRYVVIGEGKWFWGNSFRSFSGLYTQLYFLASVTKLLGERMYILHNNINKTIYLGTNAINKYGKVLNSLLQIYQYLVAIVYVWNLCCIQVVLLNKLFTL